MGPVWHSTVAAVSVRKYVDVWCDGEGCLTWADQATSHTSKEARANAKWLGWKVNLPGGRDLCPRCVREGKG